MNQESADSQPIALLELAAEERRLERELGPAGAGRVLARARSAAIDRIVNSLVPDGAKREGWALVAVGGYGRGELSLHSDIDLLVLTRRRDPVAEEVARALFYALWDAGLEVSPGVRTLAETLSLAARDLTAQTSCLQSRYLAGDQALVEELQRRTLADARRQNGRPFLRSLRADVQQRHDRSAEAAYGLEPDLKDGRGGLRDVQAMLWAGLVVLGAGTLAELVQVGYLAEDEAAAVDSAIEFLTQVRHHLHRLADRRSDRLYFSYQPDVAAALGYAGELKEATLARFTRDMNAHAASICWASDGFWERLDDQYLDGARSRSAKYPARLDLDGPAAPSDPDAALRLFAEAARRGVPVGHQLARSLKASLANARPVPAWSPSARESFLQILRAGDVVASLIEAMSGCGLLSLYLPEWEQIRYLAHYDVYHLHTVDRHSALAVREVDLLADRRSADGPLAAAVAADLADLDVVLVAALLHDLGKGLPGDHTETGADLAQTIGARVGLPPDTVETLVFLVRNHLLLARTATRRDLDDEATVRNLAEAVGDTDRLRMLYILTVADSVATGPSAWTEWKSALVRELFFRTLRLLQGDTRGAEDADSAAIARRGELRRSLLAGSDEASVDGFLNAMPASYFLGQTAASVREHLELLSRSAVDGPQISVRRLPGGSHAELILAALDRAGLLWRVCGVFALHGVNVLEARVYTGSAGQVVDIFRLIDAFEEDISDEKRALIVRDLSAVLEGRLSLSYRLGRKLRHYRPTRAEPAVQTRVTVDNNASAEYTVVEVHARDRLGLLYAITRSLSELEPDIHLSKVATRGPEAIDVFYVRDIRGRKVTDAAHIQEIEKSVVYELQEFGLEARS